MIGIVDLIITAERQLANQKNDNVANGLDCGVHYHHCFYQTSCSALPFSDAPPGVRFLHYFLIIFVALLHFRFSAERVAHFKVSNSFYFV